MQERASMSVAVRANGERAAHQESSAFTGSLPTRAGRNIGWITQIEGCRERG
jgi:hypothetical protein